MSYVSGKKASKLLGVHQRTLYNWEKIGKIKVIRTVGNHRRYKVDELLKDNKMIHLDNIKVNINYARVSSNGQKDDLERQKEYLTNAYPKNMLISDIGSGFNMNRKGLRKIIGMAIDGKINNLVVVYKDRLSRFGFELIKELIEKYSNGKIIILKQNKELDSSQELATDVLQIMNVFVAKMNGLRKYKKMKQSQ